MAKTISAAELPSGSKRIMMQGIFMMVSFCFALSNSSPGDLLVAAPLRHTVLRIRPQFLQLDSQTPPKAIPNASPWVDVDVCLNHKWQGILALPGPERLVVFALANA